MNNAIAPAGRPQPEAGHLEDLKLAATQMLGAKRRAFQAAMALKYCAGSPRQAEGVFGWNRHAVELGLHEKRTGIVGLSAQSAFAGDPLWEDKHRPRWPVRCGRWRKSMPNRTRLSARRSPSPG
jgi:hypothetical protein